MIVIIHLQRGIPSKRKSLACIDYVPALCTHRPSLLPIERFDEPQGLLLSVGFPSVGLRELMWIYSLRGSKSRNKVSVGEPAEGSLTLYPLYKPKLNCRRVEGTGANDYVVRKKEIFSRLRFHDLSFTLVILQHDDHHGYFSFNHYELSY